MPTYCYTVDGEPLQITMTIAEMEERQSDNMTIVLEDGRTAQRDFATEIGGFRGGCATWPIKSDALGVSPKQIDAAYQDARANGVPTDFTPDGRAIITSNLHQKRLAQSMGMHNRDGGYNS